MTKPCGKPKFEISANCASARLVCPCGICTVWFVIDDFDDLGLFGVEPYGSRVVALLRNSVVLKTGHLA
jgi:hypothetical protein